MLKGGGGSDNGLSSRVKAFFYFKLESDSFIVQL